MRPGDAGFDGVAVPGPLREDDNPPSHWETTATELLYGDPSSAAERLKEHFKGIQEYLAQERRRAEHARSMAAVQKFKDDNPSFNENNLASAATERAIYDGQMEDLVRLGLFDLKKYQEQTGHLSARSDGLPVRFAE